ncbi:lipoprotein LpqH [Mycobacterium sp. 663a-19]|uniref:lipoprotein LpqH n=1 Tax=Mycobacterium sp. 663a-19 TaxID=2986148 RepID=UPI002D1EA4E7|nr:lipoprotein LpqH [Mycobacterium sp. 663a-19]MEB3982313.1 lipoprotein LpqH [Mycobacterium sp. 663a-19]
MIRLPSAPSTLTPAALAGGLIVSLALAGCSAKQTATGSSAPSTAANSPAAVKVTLDGQAQDVKGPVTCDTSGGFIKIAIGEKVGGTDLTLYYATMTDTDPLDVRSVGLGEHDGHGLAYLKGLYNDTATATKSGKSYKITGTASGGLGNKPKQFEMDVTCP